MRHSSAEASDGYQARSGDVYLAIYQPVDQENKKAKKPENNMNEYQENLKIKMDKYVHSAYRLSSLFPKSELFGSVSQLRRAALSVILNYIEGYARRRPLIRLNFLESSYGSLKESKYLLHFSLVEGYLKNSDYDLVCKLAGEIGAMLWREINNLNNKIDKSKK